MITSQFRIDFWIGKIGTLLGAFILTGFLYYLSFINGSFDYQHYWFWTATLLLLWIGTRAYKFLFDELKTIVISDSGISIRYFLSEPEHIQFKDIRTMELQKVMAVRGRTRSSHVSHHELVITLHNGSTLCFDGYQYKNFGAVKSMIYRYVYHE
jgi:hypothetical protein